MAGSALIGALRVSLGLDTAQFEAGLKRSQASLDKFGKLAGTAFQVAAAGAIAAGAAMGFAVKGAIDHADALSKSAQKAGVTTEALSRLAYAADFSDVSLEGLTGGLAKLSKAMADAAVNKTSATATAFKALGIEVADASGKLRNSDVVFAEIADRFSMMEAGATKTALALQIFGKSGAEMIPLLDGGSAELKRLADEADRLGITLSTKTGKDAERFNDTLTLIGKVLQGVTNKVMEAALPAVQALAQTLASPEFASAMQDFATLAINAANAIAQVFITAHKAFKDFMAFIDGPGAGMGGNQPLFEQMTPQQRNALRLDTQMAGIAKPENLYAGFAMDAAGKIKVQQPRPAGTGDFDFFEPVIAGATKAKEAIKVTIPPLTEMQLAIRDVGLAFEDAVSSGLSGLISDVIKGKNAFEGLIGKVGELGDQLIQLAMDQAVKGLFKNLFGGFIGGPFGSLGNDIGPGATWGGLQSFLTSFDGGGYTGAGARTGGLDGLGGFPALLHPKETVIDHTKGQVGGGLTMTFNITGDREQAAVIAEIARREAMEVVRAYQSNPYRK